MDFRILAGFIIFAIIIYPIGVAISKYPDDNVQRYFDGTDGY